MELAPNVVRINFNCPTALRDAFQEVAQEQGRAVGSLLEQLMLEHVRAWNGAERLLDLRLAPDWIKRQFHAPVPLETQSLARTKIGPAAREPLEEPVEVEDHAAVSSRLL